MALWTWENWYVSIAACVWVVVLKPRQRQQSVARHERQARGFASAGGREFILLPLLPARFARHGGETASNPALSHPFASRLHYNSPPHLQHFSLLHPPLLASAWPHPGHLCRSSRAPWGTQLSNRRGRTRSNRPKLANSEWRVSILPPNPSLPFHPPLSKHPFKMIHKTQVGISPKIIEDNLLYLAPLNYPIAPSCL